ncbi:putative ATP-dependent RNA helicase DHX35 isoform X3 [Rhipicephalus microplus]|uniref:putative ATP-dependent RNA helicase DHX35 isoform X3 n=1 Tax=Rhipicephalus microplus TaxID=6941 RepID=UPI003F6C67FB
MFRKPVFQKPGGEKEFLNEEWIIEDRSSTAEYTNYVYNPNVSLSITQQRERLPVFKNRIDILYLLEKHRVLIVTGETGSGKSTQIPQYLMEAGWAQKGQMIGVTQPRRMAAITLARRVSEEKGCLVGQEVGYCVRFDECFDREGTKIKEFSLFQFMTEGILVNEIMANPLLPVYSVLMLDEAHERTLLTDTSLGLMKKILLKRPDLRLIISSATLEAEVLKQFFHSDIESKNISAEILSIQGRAYPVEVYYLSHPVPNYVKAAVETVVKIHETQRMGHVLVFLTGQDEVEEAVNLLKEYSKNTKNTPGIPSMYVLPLYGSLPQSEQPPPSKIVINALELNYALGALDNNGSLTELGMKMVMFPVPAMQAKMLLVSGEYGCSEEALTIVSMLQIESIFLFPSHRKVEARKAKYKFSVLEGDLLTLLNVYNAFLKKNKDKQWCNQMFLNYNGLTRATEIRNQLRKLLQKHKVPLVSCEGDTDLVCRCIVAGHFANAAYLHYSGEYRTVCGDHPLAIHPTSVLYTQKQPKWVVFGELTHTSREFMRNVTVVESSWLYELAPGFYQYGTDTDARRGSIL